MNISEIIKWGDIELAGGFKGLYKKGWQKVGVTSKWSARELLAHLVSYEWLLVDALKHVLKQGPTPTLDAMNEDYDKFNDNQVEVRKGKSAQALMSEYKKAYREVLKLTKKLGTAKLEKPLKTVFTLGVSRNTEAFDKAGSNFNQKILQRNASPKAV